MDTATNIYVRQTLAQRGVLLSCLCSGATKADDALSQWCYPNLHPGGQDLKQGEHQGRRGWRRASIVVRHPVLCSPTCENQGAAGRFQEADTRTHTRRTHTHTSLCQPSTLPLLRVDTHRALGGIQTVRGVLLVCPRRFEGTPFVKKKKRIKRTEISIPIQKIKGETPERYSREKHKSSITTELTVRQTQQHNTRNSHT